MFGFKHRFQEAAIDDKGGGSDKQQQQPTPAEWLKPFGEHGKAFESFKEPAELATKWTEINTELTTLKGRTAADWRQTLAGDDAEAQKVLARYTDQKAFLKTFNEAQNKIRSGELAKPLAKEATPEQVKEWRAANGVPESPEAYLQNIPGGLVIGEDDKPIFTNYAKILHEHNGKPELMHAFAKQYYADQEAETAAVTELNKRDAAESTAKLKEIWGPDYKGNMTQINALFGSLAAEEAKLLAGATLADGKLLMHSIPHMEMLAKLARETNPVAHLLPAGGGDIKTLDTEIAAMDKLMGNPNSEYWKGPQADKMQGRYRELIAARETMKGKK